MMYVVNIVVLVGMTYAAFIDVNGQIMKGVIDIAIYIYVTYEKDDTLIDVWVELDVASLKNDVVISSFNWFVHHGREILIRSCGFSRAMRKLQLPLQLDNNVDFKLFLGHHICHV